MFAKVILLALVGCALTQAAVYNRQHLILGERAPAASCSSPNGTDSALHFYDADPSAPLTTNVLYLTTGCGEPLYPVDPNGPFILNILMNYDVLGVSVSKLTYTINVQHYGDMAGVCSWDSLQPITFLMNQDGCAAMPCPMEAGSVNFKAEVDLAPVLSTFTDFGANQVFQFKLVITDATTGATLGQPVAQMLMNDPYALIKQLTKC